MSRLGERRKEIVHGGKLKVHGDKLKVRFDVQPVPMTCGGILLRSPVCKPL